MLKRLKIINYKSFKETEVFLRPLTVIFGPNGSGKSNLLDFLMLISKFTASRTLKDAFSAPYRGKPLESITFEEGGVENLLKKDWINFGFEVDVELSDQTVNHVNSIIFETKKGIAGEIESKHLTRVKEHNLRYKLIVEISPKSGIIRVKDEYLAALNKKGKPTKKRGAFIEKMDRKIHLRMEGQAHPTFYEIGLDHSILSKPLYAPHHPHLIALKTELENFNFFYLEPRQKMRQPNPVKEARNIGDMGENLASFLNYLKTHHLGQFRNIERALSYIIPNIKAIELEISQIGEVELFIREGTALIPSRLISEGTLRIIGLLALTSSPYYPTLVGFEEPENGIHPRRVKSIADYLKNASKKNKTQFIVTTHSPHLIDLIDDEDLFSCNKVEGRTEISQFKTWGALGRSEDLNSQLNKDDQKASLRIMRGDFDV